MAKEGLEENLSTYDEYAKNGPSYGEDRVLLIHANKGDGKLIKISSLRDKIK